MAIDADSSAELSSLVELFAALDFAARPAA
jgi:hypothetical protein